MVLADPKAVTQIKQGAAAPASDGTQGGGLGDCTTDTLALSGSPPAPTICGYNTGQHMIMDAQDSCHTLTINIGSSDTSTSRSWAIVVSQYECPETRYANSGPPGCLQYHTGDTGKIANFGFPTNSATVSGTVMHLSSQDYKICIRRNTGFCYICYNTQITPGTASLTSQISFGLSASANAAIGQGATNTNCQTDYLSIPGAITDAITQIALPTLNAAMIGRVCGRFFGTNGATAGITLCTKNVPFEVGVTFDADELTGISNTALISTEIVTNPTTAPGGVLGFYLAYTQKSTNCGTNISG